MMASTHDAIAASSKSAGDGPVLHAFTASVVTDNFGKRIQALEVCHVAIFAPADLCFWTVALAQLWRG